MRDHCPYGRPGSVVQYDCPVWEPLEAAVGTRLAEGFMWMHEARLAGGATMHAYKHICTRRYLYVSDDGRRAYEYSPCGGYVPLRLDYAIQAALCTWSLLDGWDAEDREAVIDAVVRAQAALR